MERLKIQKIIFKIGILAVLAMLILPTIQAFAAGATDNWDSNDYILLAPLPCIGSDQDCKTQATQTTLKDYIPGIFNLLIGLSAVAAVLMIVIGGFQYMSSDAIQGKSAGKERIKNAIFSLVLIIGAWLILYTINPNLLDLDLNISTVTTTSPPGGGTLGTGTGTSMTPDQINASNTIRASLEAKGIATYAGPCSSGQTTGCVNLNGLQSISQDGIAALKTACGTTCALTITGGTEGGHNGGTSHTDGVALDVRHNAGLDSFINTYQIPGSLVKTDWGYQCTVKVNGRDTIFLDEGTHWHIGFK